MTTLTTTKNATIKPDTIGDEAIVDLAIYFPFLIAIYFKS
jgi:hypothetical protein